MESQMLDTFPDSKVHGANMGPIWGREDPGGPHVGPMNFAIWVVVLCKIYSYVHCIHVFVTCAITNMSPLVILEIVKMKTPVAASDEKFKDLSVSVVWQCQFTTTLSNPDTTSRFVLHSVPHLVMLHLQIMRTEDGLIGHFYFAFSNKHYNIKIEK